MPLPRFGALNRLADIPSIPPIRLTQLDGGMFSSIAAWDERMLGPPLRSPLSQNTRLREGVVARAFGLTELGDVSAATDKNIRALAEFEQTSGSRFLMRVLNAQLERWNGTDWFALSGALSGVVERFPSTLTVSDFFLIANGVDRIKRWDGVDGNAVVDLSASAPIAHYLAHTTERLIAADIVDGTRNRERIQISDDADITNFATGNSDDVILPEDSSERPSPIMGLSFLFSRFIVYRAHSIWHGQPTAEPTSPFSFVETTADIGLLAPKSLAFYQPLGDIFLANDMQVYVYSGGARPIPVGFPIQQDMIDSITNFDKVYGIVDRDYHRYWLIAPVFGGTFSALAWVWEIDPWIEEQRLVWTRRTLPAEMTCLGFGSIPTGTGFINDEMRFIDEIGELIDNWQLGDSFRSVVVGGTDGKVRFPDPSTSEDEGFGQAVTLHRFPQLGLEGREIWLDTAYIRYRADSPAQVEISFSTDGGQTFGNPVMFSLGATPNAQVERAFVGLNVEQFIPQYRVLDGGRPELIGITFTAGPRGIVR